jgi:cold shock CspA family protein
MQGVVVRVFEHRGFCFIHVPGNPNDIFLHFRQADRSLAFDGTLQGKRLEFDVVEKDGKERAVNARFAS